MYRMTLSGLRGYLISELLTRSCLMACTYVWICNLLYRSARQLCIRKYEKGTQKLWVAQAKPIILILNLKLIICTILYISMANTLFKVQQPHYGGGLTTATAHWMEKRLLSRRARIMLPYIYQSESARELLTKSIYRQVFLYLSRV